MKEYSMWRHIANPPNWFTSASIFCGFYSITLAADALPGDTALLSRAAMAILFAGVFDGLDGRIARMTHTESEFGLQYDSLADIISFGVAPAFLLYRWGLATLGPIGAVVAFIYLTAGAMRLARFNIITKQMSNKYSMGLTITESGAMAASIVILHHRMGGEAMSSPLSVALLVLLLAYLMISTVRFRTMKTIRINQRTLVSLALGFMAAASVMVAYHDFTYVVVFMLAAHIGTGLIEEVIFFKQRRLEERQEVLMEELTGNNGVALGLYQDSDDADDDDP